MHHAADSGAALRWAKGGAACVLFVAPALYQAMAGLLPPAGHRRIIARGGWLVASEVGWSSA